MRSPVRRLLRPRRRPPTTRAERSRGSPYAPSDRPAVDCRRRGRRYRALCHGPLRPSRFRLQTLPPGRVHDRRNARRPLANRPDGRAHNQFGRSDHLTGSGCPLPVRPTGRLSPSRYSTARPSRRRRPKARPSREATAAELVRPRGIARPRPRPRYQAVALALDGDAVTASREDPPPLATGHPLTPAHHIAVTPDARPTTRGFVSTALLMAEPTGHHGRAGVPCSPADRAGPGLPRRTVRLPGRGARLCRLARTPLIAGAARSRRGGASSRVRVWPFRSSGEAETPQTLHSGGTHNVTTRIRQAR